MGTDILAGTYRLRFPPFGSCYWARLSGFGGTVDDINANELTTSYAVVTIKASDAGFESSGCSEWSMDLSQVTVSLTEFGEGTFIVGTDLQAGTYRSGGSDGSCYWARLSGFSGEIDEVIANDLGSGPAIVTINPSDKGFSSSGCGTWTRQ